MKIDMKEQKLALFNLLGEIFGETSIEKEKPFDWTTTYLPSEMPNDLKCIYDALVTYRGHKDFVTKRKLNCDFVIESNKTIIEYDERQHFSEARRLSLLEYPKNLSFGYPVEEWVKVCEDIQAKDNDPIYRDEQRAYYDSVRDIGAAKNGYKLIRICFKDFDWTSTGAKERLVDLIG